MELSVWDAFALADFKGTMKFDGRAGKMYGFDRTVKQRTCFCPEGRKKVGLCVRLNEQMASASTVPLLSIMFTLVIVYMFIAYF